MYAKEAVIRLKLVSFQKALPPLSTKITRKMASESADHNSLMNYYSSISRDESGWCLPQSTYYNI